MKYRVEKVHTDLIPLLKALLIISLKIYKSNPLGHVVYGK